MTGALVTDATLLAADVLAAVGDGEDGSGKGLLLLLLLAGPLFAMGMHRHYRNTDKRHHHESETRSEMLDVRKDDRKTGSRKGLKSSRMQGANNRRV